MLLLKINFKTFSLWSVSTRRWTLFLTARAKLDSVFGGCAYLSERYTTSAGDYVPNLKHR